MNIRNLLLSFFLFLGLIASYTTRADAFPISVEYTLIKLDTGDVLPGMNWTFDSSEGLFAWPHPLYEGGGITFSISIRSNTLDLTTGEGEFKYDFSMVGGDGADWLLDANVILHLPQPLDQIMIGGEYATFSDETLIPYNGQPLASLMTDQNVLTNSAVYLENMTNCGDLCFSSPFGKSLPSLPTQKIQQTLGSKHILKLAAYPFLVNTITIRTSNTALCPDFNGDRVVDSADLGILLGTYGPNSSALDLTNDGVINSADLGVLLGRFGRCPL